MSYLISLVTCLATMSRNDCLANCRDVGLRSHSPFSNTWLSSDFISGKWELARMRCLLLTPPDLPTPVLLQGSVPWKWPAYTASKGSLALLHPHPAGLSQPGHSISRLERRQQWVQVFLALVLTLPVCSGHSDFSIWGRGSLGSPLLRASCSRSRHY